MQSLEILLVVDNEAVAQALSLTLRNAGHRVIVSTTIAGTVETLMRRGPQLDVIMTRTQLDRSLGDDVIRYSRKLAPGARLIVLRSVLGGVEDVNLALAYRSVPARLRTGGSN